jgi:zinc transport system substrate-binding protein
VTILWGKTLFATPLFYSSIPPVKYLIDQISGGDLETKTIIPENSYPHSFKPTPQNIINLSRATSYFSLNAPFENIILNKIKKVSPSFNIVDCSKGSLTRKSSGHHTKSQPHDPHIWNDPENLIKISYNIYQELSRLYPNKKQYKKNFNALQFKLTKLKQKIETTLHNLKNRFILVYHPSLGHFCDSFKLKMIIVEHEGKFPSPKKLLSLVHITKKNKIKSLILWPSASKKNSETLAKVLSVKIIFFDPLAYDVYNNLLKLSQLIRGEIDNTK